MSLNDHASLLLNIVPVDALNPLYDQDQLYAAVENEWYIMKDIVEQAIIELPYDIANEETVTSVAANPDAYDISSIDKTGFNTLAPSANDYTFAMQAATNNADPTFISFGIPDGLGMRFGSTGMVWYNSVLAAGTGRNIPILASFLSKYTILPGIKMQSPSFHAAWKGISDKVGLASAQVNYYRTAVSSTLALVKAYVEPFKNWDMDNLSTSVKGTLGAVINKINLDPTNGLGLFNASFRNFGGMGIDPTTAVNKLYAEMLFGADKYKTAFGAAVLSPAQGFNALKIDEAKGTIREMALADGMLNGYDNIKNMTSADFGKLVYANYGIDTHIKNRMDGINAGEEPLPNTRDVVQRVDYLGNPIPDIKPEDYGFDSTEYLPRDLDKGMGGKPGKPDYSPLANGDTTGNTCIEKRRDRSVTGCQAADGSTFSEPPPNFGAKYPDNQVIETRGGIVVEIDSTPGHERVHVYHPSHSYFEIDTNGNMMFRNAKDRFDFVDRDAKEYTRGSKDVVVDGSATESVRGTMTIKCPMIKVNCS